MAAMSIVEKDGMFSIGMDLNEWTGLTVNGTPVQKGNTGWSYVQTKKGTLNFVATASLLTTINPNTDFVLKGEHGEDYRCKLDYSNTSNGPFVMTGTLSTEQNSKDAQEGPIWFSQGMMQGALSSVRTQIFRLTTVSQNDNGATSGDKLTATVTDIKGGKLVGPSSPMNKAVDMPIPPAQGVTPPMPPTWFMELDGSIDDASFTVEISGPAPYPTTTIEVKGSDMAAWVAANKIEKTNQIYSKGNDGIFGFAQEDSVVDGNLNWIYSITGGVVNPMVHPPVLSSTEL